MLSLQSEAVFYGCYAHLSQLGTFPIKKGLFDIIGKVLFFSLTKGERLLKGLTKMKKC